MSTGAPPWAVALLVAAAVLTATAGARPPACRALPTAPSAAAPGGAALRRGRWWRAVWRRDRVASSDPALAMDLLAAALLSGAPVPTALAVVGEALGGPDGEHLASTAGLLAMGSTPEDAWSGAGPRWVPLARCLALASASGAPTAGLLRQAARRERADRALRQHEAAQRLGVRVLLPLGLCALPGFAALGVVPLVLALAGSLTGTGP